MFKISSPKYKHGKAQPLGTLGNLSLNLSAASEGCREVAFGDGREI